jgi:hypothetical protein
LRAQCESNRGGATPDELGVRIFTRQARESIVDCIASIK